MIRERPVKLILDLNKSCKSSPVLDAVNLAAFGVGFALVIAPMVVFTVVLMVVRAAMTVQHNVQCATFRFNPILPLHFARIHSLHSAVTNSIPE